MSFILEALRKSENERQRVTSATVADLPVGRKSRGQPWWVVALAILLFINLIVLIVVLARDPSAPAKQDSNSSATNLTANPAQYSQRQSEYRQPAITQPNYVAPPATTLPPTNSPLNVRPLPQEAASAPQVTYESVPRAEMELANAGASVPDGPTLVRPIDPNATNGSVPTGTTSNRITSLQDIHIDLHVFSQNRRDSFVLINMRRYTEGQRLAEGALLEQITPEGIVLNYNGARYQVNRN